MLNRLVCRHPWITIAAFTLVTALAVLRLPALDVEVDVDAMLPRNNPEIAYKDWAIDYFGIPEAAVVMIIDDGDDGVFSPQTLALVDHVSEAVKELDSIHGDDLVSLSEVDDITADGDSLLVEQFFDAAPADRAGAQAVRRAVFDNPMIVDGLVSRDGKATLIVGEIVPGADKRRLYQDLVRIVGDAPVSTQRVAIAGRPVIEGEMGSIAIKDVRLMFPLVVVVAAVVLWMALRCVRGVVLPLLVVVSAVIWMLGVMAWTGSRFYALSNSMPIILIPIGIADGIHIIHHYLITLAADPERSPRETVIATMDEMTRPVVMTSITTAVGIGSLAISSIASIRSFGGFTAVGVLAAMVFSLTLLPALLCVLPQARSAAVRVPRAGERDGGWAGRLLDGVSTFVVTRSRTAVGLGVALLLVGAAGIPRIVVDASLLKNFPHDNPVKLSDALFVEHFRGSLPLEIVLDGGANDAWKEPEKLRALVGLQEHLERGGLVGDTRSIADYIKRMNEVMNPEDADAYRIPDDRQLVAQYLLLYSISGEPDDFDDVVDYDYRLANLRARVMSDHSPVLGKVFEDLDAYAEAHLEPAGIDVHGSGVARTMHTFIGLIVSGQVRSLLIAVPLVFLLTAVMCAAPAAGWYAVMPIAVATVLNFGVLGWLGVTLGVTTALMSSIGIGIGVDYAIHFLVRYQRARRAHANPREAMRETMATSGVAILFNAIVVVAGFMVLANSDFLPNRVLGYLVSFNMLVCFFCTVTMMAGAIHLGQPAFVLPKGEREEAVAGEPEEEIETV